MVSVIIPVYNGAKFIAKTLQNILDQQIADFEIITVDDGSTDESATIIKNFPYPINYIYQPNQGPAAARNTGIKVTQGEYIAFLDVDDEWTPGKINRQLDYFNEHPDVNIVWGKTKIYYEDENCKQHYVKERFRYPELVQEEAFHITVGSGLFCKKVFEIVGLFDESLRYGEDADWYNRVIESEVHIVKTDDIALKYYLHSNNMTSELKAVDHSIIAVKLIKKSLDRRRQHNKL